MEYYYCPDIQHETLFSLQGEEHLHCTKVMRHRPGDFIFILDGKGSTIKARIHNITAAETRLEFIELVSKDAVPTPKVVAISPTKNPARLEWFVEKATETGVSGIILVNCERTEKKSNKVDRLHKIILSAMKQSGSTWLPYLYEAKRLRDLASLLKLDEYRKYIAYCNDSLQHVRNFTNPLEPQVICIGPEGDFTKNEVDWALSTDFIPVSLGKNRLRTETAGLYALFCMDISATP